MKQWILLVVIVMALAALGFTANMWADPLLEFAGTHTDTIQGISDLIQIFLYVVSGIILLVGAVKNVKSSKSQSPDQKGTKEKPTIAYRKRIVTASSGGVASGGNMKGNIIITGDQNVVQSEEDDEHKEGES